MKNRYTNQEVQAVFLFCKFALCISQQPWWEDRLPIYPGACILGIRGLCIVSAYELRSSLKLVKYCEN